MERHPIHIAFHLIVWKTFLTITTYHFSPETVDINCWHIWKVCSCSVSPGSGQCPESAVWLRLREQSEHLELSKQWWNPKKSPLYWWFALLCTNSFDTRFRERVLKKLLVAQLVCQWKQVPTPLDLCSQCASSLSFRTRHLGHERETPRPLGDAPVVTRVTLSFLEYRGLYKYLCFKSPYIFAT